MEQATNDSLIGKIADRLGINKKFHLYKEINVNPNDNALISPVEGKIVSLGNINEDGIIISKNNKEIHLKKLIGEHYKQFANGIYKYLFI